MLHKDHATNIILSILYKAGITLNRLYMRCCCRLISIYWQCWGGVEIWIGWCFLVSWPRNVSSLQSARLPSHLESYSSAIFITFFTVRNCLGRFTCKWKEKQMITDSFCWGFLSFCLSVCLLCNLYLSSISSILSIFKISIYLTFSIVSVANLSIVPQLFLFFFFFVAKPQQTQF